MNDLEDIAARLRAAGDLAAMLAASFDGFEAIRSAARACEDLDPGLLPAFMLAAGAAVEGRNTVAAAPPRPRAHGGQLAAPEPGADVEAAADGLAALAGLLAGRLSAVAAQAAAPGDRDACVIAAGAAAQIGQLLTRSSDAAAVR